MRNVEQHRSDAKLFIEDVIKKSKKDYRSLMVDLANQVEKWKDNYRELSYINIFELTEAEYDRKNYLDALIYYSEKLLAKERFNKLKKLTKTLIIRGNNLSIEIF
jgi:hypothetical protein